MKSNVSLALIISITLSFLLFPYLAMSGSLKIEGRVFNDKNCNGQRNSGDNGISGVTVTLKDSTETTTYGTDTTGSNGKYMFQSLSAGTYKIIETDPSGYCSTTPNKITVTLGGKNINNQDFGDSKLVVSPGSSCCPSE